MSERILAFFIGVSILASVLMNGCAAKRPQSAKPQQYEYILRRECLPPVLHCGHDEHCHKPAPIKFLCDPEIEVSNAPQK